MKQAAWCSKYRQMKFLIPLMRKDANLFLKDPDLKSEIIV